MRIIIGALITVFIFIINVQAAVQEPVTIDSSIVLSDDPVVAQTEDFVHQGSDDSITQILQASVPKSVDGAKAALPQEQSPTVENKPEVKPEGSGILVVDEAMIKDLSSRISALEVQNTILHNQISQLTDKLGSGESSASTKNVGAFAQKVREHVDVLKNQMGYKTFMGVVAGIIAVLAFLLIYILIPRGKSHNQVSYPKDDLPNDEKDFNFMEGNEGIAAKLNLARAYIEMGHESKAQSMLYEVLSYGNDHEQAEAKSLLDKIKQHNF